MKTITPAQKPFPFSVGFPLSIRQQADSIAICGANRGDGWPILCEVPKTEHAEKDARSIVAACTSHVANALELSRSDHDKISSLKDALAKLCALHENSVFICGEGDQEEVDLALTTARAAITKATNNT